MFVPQRWGRAGKVPAAGGKEASWGARGELRQDRAKADGAVLEHLCRRQRARAAFFPDGSRRVGSSMSYGPLPSLAWLHG